MAGDRCVYCGEALPSEVVAEARPATRAAAGERAAVPPPPDAPAPPAAERSLLVLNLDAARAETLGPALGFSLYEADLLARRGGFHLLGILEPAAAETERKRLAAAGLAVEVLPEDEARVEPCRAFGGGLAQGTLTLRTEQGPVTVRREDLLLVVGGMIARQYQPSYRGRRLEMASLDEGFRVHLHRHCDLRPLEIDSTNFEFGAAVTGSTHLELEAWLDEIADGVPRDDGFRRLPPAFGVAAPEPKGPLSAASALGRATREGKSVVLDNAAQFRFYSAWRAALERRRSPRPPTPVLG